MNKSRQLDSVTSQVLPKGKIRHSQSRIYRRFNLGFIAIALAPIFTVGLFNIAIDPYGVFNSPVFAGMNKAKPEKFNQDLLFKTQEINRLKPTIIFLGSSRTQWGLDPTHPGLAKNETAYNLGLQASNMYVVKRYFDHAIYNQPNLKQVIIGIDFLMFNSLIKPTSAFSETRLEKRSLPSQEILNVLFSLDAFNTSTGTLDTNRKNSQSDYIFVNRFMVKDSIYVNGMLAIDDNTDIPGSREKFTRNMARGFRYPTPYKFSPESLENLKSIVDICKKRGIDLKIFITPSHTTDLEAIRARGLWSDFEQWKREVSKVAPVWDFSSYNSVTAEQISNDMKYFIDSFHFNKEGGNLILNRMLSYQPETVPDDFGILITPDNIESNLDLIRAQRELWASKNPDLVKLVEAIKGEQDKAREAESK